MPPDPKLLSGTTPAQRIAMWFDLMRTADKLLIAGMRHRLGPSGDIREEYRRWYADQMREHDKVVERIVSRSQASHQEYAHGR